MLLDGVLILKTKEGKLDSNHASFVCMNLELHHEVCQCRIKQIADQGNSTVLSKNQDVPLGYRHQ